MVVECNKKKEIHKVNIEFRQKPMAALKYLTYCSFENLLTEIKNNRITLSSCSEHINNMVQKLNEDNSIKEKLINQQNEYDLPIKDCLESFNNTLSTIKNYNDGNTLNSYYETAIAEIIKQGENTFSIMTDNQDLTFSKFIEFLQKNPFFKGRGGSIFAEKYLIHATNFISINALHQIHQSFTTTNNAFLLTTMEQANNVVEKLQQLEYYESIAYKGISQETIQKYLQQRSKFSSLDICMHTSLSKHNDYDYYHQLADSMLEVLEGASLDNINFLGDYLLRIYQ